MLKSDRTINWYIQKYEPLINRKAFKLSSLREFVNGMRQKPVTSSTLRTIFVGNDDFYKNGYMNIARDRYVPKEKFSHSNSIIDYLRKDSDYMSDGLSLGRDLGINVQDIRINSYIIFGNKPKDDQTKFFSNWIKTRYIEIEEDRVRESFKILFSLNSFDNPSDANEYLNSISKDFKYVMDEYDYLSKHTNLLKTELLGIESKLWKASVWQK